MPTIIICADTSVREAPLITLSERLVAENLNSSHYAAQLIERISWAAEDAQTLEAHESDSPPGKPARDDSPSWERPPAPEDPGSPSAVRQTPRSELSGRGRSLPAAERAHLVTRSLVGGVEQVPALILPPGVKRAGRRSQAHSRGAK